MKIDLREQSFDPYREIEAFRSGLDLQGEVGATASFVGSMRDFNENRRVSGMMLEYYPAMTKKHIHRICEEAARKWTLLDVLVIHRVGEIRVDEAIVVIAVFASHRGDAMDACRFILEDLKSKAPFWKKEHLDEGDRWVEGNTSGYVGREG